MTTTGAFRVTANVESERMSQWQQSCCVLTLTLRLPLAHQSLVVRCRTDSVRSTISALLTPCLIAYASVTARMRRRKALVVVGAG